MQRTERLLTSGTDAADKSKIFIPHYKELRHAITPLSRRKRQSPLGPIPCLRPLVAEQFSSVPAVSINPFAYKNRGTLVRPGSSRQSRSPSLGQLEGRRDFDRRGRFERRGLLGESHEDDGCRQEGTGDVLERFLLERHPPRSRAKEASNHPLDDAFTSSPPPPANPPFPSSPS